MAKTHPRRRNILAYYRDRLRHLYSETNWGLWWLLIVLMLGVITWRAYFPPSPEVLNNRAPMMREAANESRNVITNFFGLIQDTKERIDDVEIEVIWPTPEPTGAPKSSSKTGVSLNSSLFFTPACIDSSFVLHSWADDKKNDTGTN